MIARGMSSVTHLFMGKKLNNKGHRGGEQRNQLGEPASRRQHGGPSPLEVRRCSPACTVGRTGPGRTRRRDDAVVCLHAHPAVSWPVNEQSEPGRRHGKGHPPPPKP